MVDKGYYEDFVKIISEGKQIVAHWGAYLVDGDWMHEKIYSSAAMINDVSKIPQELFDITSDVDPSCASYYDWMAGSNDVRGYCLVILRRGFARLEMVVGLNFKLVDFKVFFQELKSPYGFSNTFSDNITPKSLIDAFWTGKDEKEVRSKLDVLLNGRLDQKIT